MVGTLVGASFGETSVSAGTALAGRAAVPGLVEAGSEPRQILARPGSRAGAEQHLAMVRMRAIENRTWLVRATPTGISAIVDPLGVFRARAEPEVEEVLVGEARLSREATLYQSIGDAFAWLCVAVSIGAIAFVASRRRAD